MIIDIGNKKDFAISFQVCQIERQSLWGGFEIWINNHRFGDINYYDVISGNNYLLAEKIVSNPVPDYLFPSPQFDLEIVQEIFSSYSGESQTHLSTKPKTIQEVYHQSVYWEKFILLPNGNMCFDTAKLVYFMDGNKVALLYLNGVDASVVRFIMSVFEFKRTAKQFIDMHNEIVEGKREVILIDKSNLY